jgi:hypothetical protein
MKMVQEKAQSVVDPKEIWKALRRDSEFSLQTVKMQRVYRPYTEVIPVVLKKLLDQPVTFDSVIKAWVVFHRYCIRNGFVEKSIQASPRELRKFAEGSEGFIKKATLAMCDMLMNLIKNNPEVFLVEKTEDRVLLVEKFGLSGEALEMYDKGELTIGKLLVTQPLIIFNSKPKS